MIRTTLVLLLALIGITTADFFNCKDSGKLLEYKRVPGTKKIQLHSNEDDVEDDVDIWNYNFDSTVPFVWDGSHRIRFDLKRFPGTIDTVSYHSVHHVGDTDRVFPQSRVSNGLRNKYSTNQLVIEDFQHHISVGSLGLTQPIAVNIRVLEYKPKDDFFYAFNLATNMPNGYPRSFWAEGTQFQRFNEGKIKDCPLHNGFVVDTQCDFTNVNGTENQLTCDGDQQVTLFDTPVYLGSGNPATYEYTISNSSCSYTIEQDPTNKRDPKDTVLVFTWWGTASDDEIIVETEDGTRYQRFADGSGFNVMSVPSEKVIITFNRNPASTFPGSQEVHGFRVVAFTEGQGRDNCLEVGQSCENERIKTCVLATTNNKCADSWDEQCVVVADICKSFFEAELEAISDYYDFAETTVDIQEKLELDVYDDEDDDEDDDDGGMCVCRKEVYVNGDSVRAGNSERCCFAAANKRSEPTPQVKGLQEFSSLMKHIKA